MIIIGLTGGIASGKSVVASILKDIGAKIVDCDLVAKELLKKGRPAFEETLRHFGSGILSDFGEIDSKKLAEIVFNNKDELNVLNEITHKYVYLELEKIINEIKEDTKKLGLNDEDSILVIEASVPEANRFKEISDEIWTVVSEKENRINRIINRDRATRENAVRRIESQMNDDDYAKMADHVIMNKGSKEDLIKVVEELFEQAKQLRLRENN